MANRAIWNVRRRHEWLAGPAKKPHLSKRDRVRIGLEDALQHKDLTALAYYKGIAKRISSSNNSLRSQNNLLCRHDLSWREQGTGLVLLTGANKT